MKALRLSTCLVLLLMLICSVTAKNHKTQNQKGYKERNENLIHKDFSRFDDGSERSEDGQELSPSEREEKLKILTMEGKPGWLELVQKRINETAKKLAKKIIELKKAKQNDKAKNVHHDLNFPTEIISDVKNKLSGFTGPLATHVKTEITDLKTKWTTMKNDERKSISDTLGVVASNIEKLGDAGSNPVGAVQGALYIVGAISTFFGPAGQLASIGLSFVSSLLGLFGKGPKPKPMADIVREQIDEALDEYRYQELTDKAGGLITAYSGTKAYLDGAVGNLSIAEIGNANTNVPIYLGIEFIGELTTVIKRMFKTSKASDAHKCIKYCELFAQIAGLKEMLLTQLIALHGDKLRNSVSMLMSYLIDFREAAKVLLKPLFKADFGQKILPYFDPDISVVTDTYATAVLDLGKYDRSRAGMYCLTTPFHNQALDLVWSTAKSRFHVNGKPYATTAANSDNNCYWKLVPHGNNLFSIVNKKGCDATPPAAWCGSLLSFDIVDDRGRVDLEATGGIMWEILGNEWTRIRSKWGCGGSKPNSYCNRELRIEDEVWLIHRGVPHGPPPKWGHINLGFVLPTDDYLHWKLRKLTKQ